MSMNTSTCVWDLVCKCVLHTVGTNVTLCGGWHGWDLLKEAVQGRNQELRDIVLGTI